MITAIGYSGLADTPCYDPFTHLEIACDGTGNNISWWDNYGPTIVSILGSVLVKVGDKWQQSASNQQILEAIKAATGGGSGTPSQSTIDQLAQQLATTRGISVADAKSLLTGTVGNGVPSQSSYPSWLLPVGIGILAFALLRGKGGA